MAKATRKTPEPKGFRWKPGLGQLFHSKNVQNTAVIWEGNATLPNNQDARVQAIAVIEPGKNGKKYYDVKIMNVDDNTAKYGPKWAVLDNVQVAPFGDRNYTTFDTKAGRIRFWRQLPKNGQDASIRIRFMTDASSKYVGPVPL